MKIKSLISWAIVNSMAAFAYIVWVAWLLFNGSSLFGKEDSFWMPVALLLLFVLSATIVGSLVLGRPIYIYLEGKKEEAVKLLVYTIACMFVITVITFFGLALLKQ